MSFVVNYIFPFAYALLFVYAFRFHPVVKSQQVAYRSAIALFVLKCIGGIVFTFMAFYFIPNKGDVWPWFYESRQLYRLLLEQPSAFPGAVNELFSVDHATLAASDSALARNAYSSIKFFLVLLNLFSGANLVTNTILFNALATWVLLYAVDAFSQLTKHSAIAWAWVLIPSVIMYSSTLIKEGIVFTAVSGAVYLLIHCEVQKAGNKRRLLFVLIVLLLLVIKAFTALFFLASFVWYLIARSLLLSPARFMLLTIVAGSVLFFSVGYLFPSVDPLHIIIARQQEFAALPAASAIPAPVLQHSIFSFVSQLPLAVFNSLFQPLPGVGGKMLYLVYALEISGLWMVTIFFAVKAWRQARRLPLLLWMLLLFGLLNLLFIGYIVPNVGAIVRYRSIFLPCLFIPAWYVFSAAIPFRKNG